MASHSRRPKIFTVVRTSYDISHPPNNFILKRGNKRTDVISFIPVHFVHNDAAVVMNTKRGWKNMMTNTTNSFGTIGKTWKRKTESTGK
jgi:hypothetical protein